MTYQPAGFIKGKPYAAEDTGGLTCLECMDGFPNATAFAGHVAKCGQSPKKVAAKKPAAKVAAPTKPEPKGAATGDAGT